MACAYYSLPVYSASGYFHVEGEQDEMLKGPAVLMRTDIVREMHGRNEKERNSRKQASSSI